MGEDHVEHRDWKHDGVRVIKGDWLDNNTPQTPGMHRQADLRVQINAARIALEEAQAEYEHAEKLQQRDLMREESDLQKAAG